MPQVVFAETGSWGGSGVGRCNEDYARMATGQRCAVLVDGATGLTTTNLVHAESDAAWYARELCHALLDVLGTSMPTQQALASAGSRVAKSYLSLPGATELSRQDLPNGSVAVLRWDDDAFEVTMLGDCTAVVLTRDGCAHIVHDGTLDALDQDNYERMYRYAMTHGTTMAQARQAVNPSFVANRLKMNEPDGYWAADVTCRGFGHELQRSFSLGEVAGAVACSDGFSAAVAMGAAPSLEALARRVLAREGAKVAKELRAAENKDTGCWRVHRSKTSDDATYVALAFA